MSDLLEALLPSVNRSRASNPVMEANAAAEREYQARRATDRNKASILAEASERRRNELSNISASTMEGVGNTIAGVGNLYGVLTGDVENPLAEFGEGVAENFGHRKPLHLREAEAQRTQDIANTEGEWAKAGVAAWETLKNPSLLMSLGTGQLGNLAFLAATGGAGGAGAKLLGKSAEAINKARTGSAIAGGGGLQGADVGKGVYEDIAAMPLEVKRQNPEFVALEKELGEEQATHQVALKYSRAALGAAGAASVAINTLVPGASMMESVISGAGRKTSGNMLTRALTGGLAEGVLSEAPEEFTGAVAGNVAKAQVDASQGTFEGAGEASGLGAIGGGVVGGVTNALAGDPEKAQERRNTAAQAELAEAAVATGDVSALLDASSPETFAPDTAVAALTARYESENTTDEEKKTARSQIDQIIRGLDNEGRQATADLLAVDPGELESLKSDKEKMEARLKNEPDMDPETRQRIEAYLPKMEAQIASIENATPEDISKAEQRLNLAKQRYSNAVEARDQILNNENASPEQVTQDIETAADTTAEEPARKESAKRSLQFLMEGGDGNLPPDELTKLQNSGVLDETEQEYVDQVVETRKIAEKTMDNVSKDVVQGASGFKGLNQYRSELRNAFKQNDQETFKNELKFLGQFRDRQIRKQKAVQTAVAKTGETGKSHFIREDMATGEFVVSPEETPVSRKKRKTAWAWEVSPKKITASTRLLGSLNHDIANVQAAGAEFAAGYRAKWGGQPSSTFKPTKRAQATTTPNKPADKKPVAPQATAGGATASTNADIDKLKAELKDLIDANDTKGIRAKVKELNTALEAAKKTANKDKPKSKPAKKAAKKTKAVPSIKESDSDAVKKLKTELHALRQGKDKEAIAAKAKELNGVLKAEREAAKAAAPKKPSKNGTPTLFNGEKLPEGLTAEMVPEVFLRDLDSLQGEELLEVLRDINEIEFNNGDYYPDFDLTDAQEEDLQNLIIKWTDTVNERGWYTIIEDEFSDSEAQTYGLEPQVILNSAEDLQSVRGELLEFGRRPREKLTDDEIYTVEQIEALLLALKINPVSKWDDRTGDLFDEAAQVTENKEGEGRDTDEDGTDGEPDTDGTDSDAPKTPVSVKRKATVELKTEDDGKITAIYSNEAGEEIGFANVSVNDDYISIGPSLSRKFLKQGYGQAIYLATAAAYPGKELRSTNDLSPEAEAMWERLVASGKATKEKMGEYSNGEPEFQYTIPAKPVPKKKPKSEPIEEDEGLTPEEIASNLVAAILGDLNDDQNAPEITNSALFTADTSENRAKPGGPLPLDRFQKKNLVQYYFQQRPVPNNPKKSGILPLAHLPDFLSNWVKDPKLVRDMLPDGDVMTDGQRQLMYGFFTEAPKLINSIRDNIFEPQSESNFTYLHRDPIHYFRTGDKMGTGPVEENVLTAAALGAYVWMARHGGRNGYNRPADINAMLGRDAKFPVTAAEIATYGWVGTNRNIAVMEMGEIAFDALGLEAKDVENLPAGTKEQVILGLGARSLQMLQAEKLLVTEQAIVEGVVRKDPETGRKVNVPLDQAGEIQQGEKVIVLSYAERVTVRPARQKPAKKSKLTPKPVARVQAITEASKGNTAAIDAVFGVKNGKQAPSFKPTKFDQKSPKRMDQDIPAKQRKTAEAFGKKPHKMVQTMLTLKGLVGDESILRWAGKKDTSEELMHVKQKEYLEAVNVGLEEDLNNLNYFLDIMGKRKSGTNAPFFFTMDVWRMQRAGLAENMLDPQQSKMHRQFIAMDSWATEVDTSDANSDTVTFLKLAIAQSLGIATDKQPPADSLAQLETKVRENNGNNPVMRAVRALQTASGRKNLSPAKTAELTAAMDAAVEAGGENLHTVSGLQALADYLTARETGATFTTTMYYEVDGVTSGPALGYTQLGVGAAGIGLRSLSKRYGIFTDRSPEQTFGEYRANSGNDDMYEILARMTGRDLRDMVDGTYHEKRGRDKEKWQLENDAASVNAIEFFMREGDTVKDPLSKVGDSAVPKYGRNLMKEAMRPIVFGGSVDKVIANMRADLEQAMYTALQKAVRETRATQDKTYLNEVIDHANHLISGKKTGKHSIPKGRDAEYYLNIILSTAEKQELEKKYYWTFAQAFTGAMNGVMGDFTKRRAFANNAANLTYELFNAVYQSEKQKLIEELGDKLPARKGKLGEQGGKWQGLTPAMEKKLLKRLQDVFPIVHTAMSKEEGNLNAGLAMLARKRGLAKQHEGEYRVMSETKTPISRNDRKTSHIKQLAQQRQFDLGAMRFEDSQPGVSAIVLMIHAMESGIATDMLGEFDALNLHDAGGFGINDMVNGSQKFNEATLHHMLNYSLLDEVQDTATRVWSNALKYFDYQIPQELAIEIEENLSPPLEGSEDGAKNPEAGFLQVDAFEGDFMESVAAFFEELKEETAQANANRLALLSEITTIDHYSGPGSAYNVPQSVRDAAKAEAESRNLPEPDIDDLIEKAAKNEAANKKPEGAVESVWGETSRPQDGTYQPMIQFFRDNNGETTAKEFIKRLRQWTKTDADNKTDTVYMTIQNKMLEQLGRQINPNLPIRTVGKLSPKDPTVEITDGTFQASGLFNIDKGDAQIILKNEEFNRSGMTVEAAVHELFHGTAGVAIQNELDRKKLNDKYTSVALDAINEIEELRKKAQEKYDGLTADQLKAAGVEPQTFKNVHEFISWGMTNKNAIEFLAGIQVPAVSENKDLRTVSGLQKLFQSLVRVLFKLSPKDKRVEPWANVWSALALQTTTLLDTIGDFDSATNPNNSYSFTLHHLGADGNQSPESYSTQQVLDALGKHSGSKASPSHADHLSDVLRTVTEAVYGPFGVLKEVFAANAASSAVDTWLNALQNDALPFASKSLGMFRLDSQSAFALESIELTAREGLKHTAPLRNQVRDLFQHARSELSPADFYNGDFNALDQNDPQRQLAKDQYDFIFKISPNQDKTSDHLSRFMALSLAYEPLRMKMNALQPLNKKYPVKGGTVGQTIHNIVERLGRIVRRLIMKDFNSANPAQAMAGLGIEMARLENARKASLNRNRDRPLDKLDAKAERGVGKLAKQMEKFGDHAFFQNNRFQTVGALGMAISTIANGDRAEVLIKKLTLEKDKIFKERQGVLAALVSEVKGPAAQFQALTRIMKRHESLRGVHNTETAHTIRDGFANPLTETQSTTMTKWIRTDPAKLMDKYSLEQLESMLRDKSNVLSRERELEAELGQISPDYAAYWLQKSKQLAYMMVTGKAVGKNTLLNAHNIANLHGTPDMGRITAKKAKDAEKIIDVLTSMYAIEYMAKPDKDVLVDLMATERNRQGTDENGVETVLKFHTRMQFEAKRDLFEGDEIHFIKGYVRETYSPYVDIKIATEEEGRMLEFAGYIKNYPVNSAPGHQRFLYSRRDGGIEPWLNGFLSTTGERARGSKLHSGEVSIDGAIEFEENIEATEIVAAAGRKVFEQWKKKSLKDGQAYDPRRVGKYTSNEEHRAINEMVPVLNHDGQIVNYRYMMQETTKDTVLDRENTIDTVMGATAASVYDKMETPALNEAGIQALKDQYDEDFAKNSDAYIKVGPNSSDPTIKESYRLLPNKTKLHIRAVWGGSTMMIRKDHLDLAMGYRKRSATEAFGVEWDERTFGRKLATSLLAAIFSPTVPAEALADERRAVRELKASFRMKKAGDMWQEAVKMVKDIWVIKNLVTLVGNTISNYTQLLWEGVSPVDIVKNHIIAFQGMREYSALERERVRLNHHLASDNFSGDVKTEAEARVKEIEADLAANPVRELVDAGLFQTIIEDVALTEDQFSYKSRLSRWGDKKTQRLPEGVKTFGKTMFMAHGTPLYAFMAEATQLSDFMARYTLIQHTTKRKYQPLTMEAALHDAGEAFVGYDLPTHRNVQYANDTGMVPFTKYYLRIQKKVFRLLRRNPARALMIAIYGQMFPGAASIHESFFWDKLSGNVMSSGAFELPEAMTQIVPIRAAMAPF